MGSMKLWLWCFRGFLMTLEECHMMFKPWSICHLHRLKVKNVMPLSPWKSSTGLSRNRIYWEKSIHYFRHKMKFRVSLAFYEKAQPFTALQRRASPRVKYQQHWISSITQQKQKLQKALIPRISTWINIIAGNPLACSILLSAICSYWHFWMVSNLIL